MYLVITGSPKQVASSFINQILPLSLLWSTYGGQDDVTHWAAVMEWWGEASQLAALETLCVPLCRWGGLVPTSLHCRSCLFPANMGGVHQEGPGISTEGVVRELEVKWSTWRCRRKRELYMKTRGLTTHPKRPTNLFSPCCGQLSTRSPSPTSTAECSGPESLTIKPTVWLF